jgi:uncharacterized protein DUF3352
MTSKRKIGIIFILAVALVAIVYFLILRPGSKQLNAFDAIPGDAGVIVQINDPSNTVSGFRQDTIWPKLMSYKPVSELNAQLEVLFKLFGSNKTLLKKSTILASLQKASAESFGILYVIEFPSGGNKLLSPILQNDSLKYKKRLFKGFPIYEPGQMNGRKFSITRSENLLIISEQSFLVEEAIARLSNEKPGTKDKYFKQIAEKAAKNKDLKVFLNFDNLPGFLSIYFDRSQMDKSNRSGFAKWAVLDIQLVSNSILINGYLNCSEDQKLLANLEEPGVITDHVTKVIPFNTAYLKIVNSLNFNNGMDRDSDKMKIFDKYFVNWLGQSVGFFITEPFSTAFKDQCFLVCSVSDTQLAKTQLKMLLLEKNRLEEYFPIRYKAFDIYKIDGLADADQILGFNSEWIDNPYFVFIENFVVFANDAGNLKLLIERYLEQQTLAKDIDYRSFEDKMTDNPILHLFINSSRALNILKKYSNPSFQEYLQQDFKSFTALNPVGLQISKYVDNVYLINGLIQSYGEFQETTNLIWKTELDTVGIRKPQIVINHHDKSKEIVMQDAANTFYLITEGGEVLWKKRLDAPIVGDLLQVDFYRNAKLQYLFATEKSIYLIDRKGRDVENFPLKLPATITSGIAVFDYDKNGKYRMFVGCANGNVYGFYKSGQPLPGWSPRRNVGVLNTPLKFVSVKNKDYLIARNKKGEVFYFNRKGQTRIKPFKVNGSFLQNFRLIRKKKTFNLLNADVRGKIVSIDQTGNVQVDSITGFTGRVLFGAVDITGNDSLDYIFMDEKYLRAFDENKSPVFEYLLPEDIDRQLYFAKITDQGYLPGFVSQTGWIYMVDLSGSLHEGFPVRGNSFETTFQQNDGAYILYAVLNDNTLTAYRLK